MGLGSINVARRFVLLSGSVKCGCADLFSFAMIHTAQIPRICLGVDEHAGCHHLATVILDLDFRADFEALFFARPSFHLGFAVRLFVRFAVLSELSLRCICALFEFILCVCVRVAFCLGVVAS